MHCGLRIGFAAGKCCAERIGEEGGDFGLERFGHGVMVKTVARSVSLDDYEKHNKKFSSRQEISKQAPPYLGLLARLESKTESKQVTRSLLTHNPTSLELCERLVGL